MLELFKSRAMIWRCHDILLFGVIYIFMSQCKNAKRESFYTRINSALLTIRRVTRIVHEFTFGFTGRASLGRLFRLERIPAFCTFPTCHRIPPVQASLMQRGKLASGKIARMNNPCSRIIIFSTSHEGCNTLWR